MSGNLTWFKSSRSQPQTADCVEAALLDDGGALVRDSKGGADSPVLAFDRSEWAAFLAGVRLGEFDNPSA